MITIRIWVYDGILASGVAGPISPSEYQMRFARVSLADDHLPSSVGL